MMAKNSKSREHMPKNLRIFLHLGNSKMMFISLFFGFGLIVACFRYDYWYQPFHNVMISTEWGTPNKLMNGLDVEHVAQGHYGTHLNVYDWEKHKLIQKIDLGMEGVMPLEIR